MTANGADTKSEVVANALKELATIEKDFAAVELDACMLQA